MTYGIRIYKPNGQVSYDTDMVTWNQLGVISFSRNQAFSTSIPQTANKETLLMCFFVDAPPIDREAHAPLYALNGGTFSVYPGFSGTSEAVAVVGLIR